MTGEGQREGKTARRMVLVEQEREREEEKMYHISACIPTTMLGRMGGGNGKRRCCIKAICGRLCYHDRD